MAISPVITPAEVIVAAPERRRQWRPSQPRKQVRGTSAPAGHPTSGGPTDAPVAITALTGERPR